MFTKRIVAPLIAVLLALLLGACTSTASPGTTTTTAAVTAPQTVTVTAAPPTVTLPPLPAAQPSDQADTQQRFDKALDWIELVTKKGTAASIYGLARALNCVATPQDWARIQPYASTLYQRAAGKALPPLDSATCDKVKNTIEDTAARWYTAVTSRAQ